MKLRLVFVVAVLLLVGVVTMAIAQGDSESFTGCLTNGGTLVKVAIGDEPAQPCSNDQTEVSWNRQGPPGPPGPAGGDDRLTYETRFAEKTLLPGGDPIDVMTLELPAGSWLAHVTVIAGPNLETGFGLEGIYHCALAFGEDVWNGHPGSSGVTELRYLAWSQPFGVEEETTVAIRCWYGAGDGATLLGGSWVATPIGDWVIIP